MKIKNFKIILKLKKYFGKNSLKNLSKEYKSTFAFSFMIGMFIATIPYSYKFIENFRHEILIQEQINKQIHNKENVCKNDNSDFIKFLNLGFPETATQKFNDCMREQ